MVAPSFQTYKIVVAEPFTKDGRLYVTVEHPRTHNHRDVRWYTDREYARLYGKKEPIVTPIVTVREPCFPRATNLTVTHEGNKTTIKGTTSNLVYLWMTYAEKLRKGEIE